MFGILLGPSICPYSFQYWLGNFSTIWWFLNLYLSWTDESWTFKIGILRNTAANPWLNFVSYPGHVVLSEKNVGHMKTGKEARKKSSFLHRQGRALNTVLSAFAIQGAFCLGICLLPGESREAFEQPHLAQRYMENSEGDFLANFFLESQAKQASVTISGLPWYVLKQSYHWSLARNARFNSRAVMMRWMGDWMLWLWWHWWHQI